MGHAFILIPLTSTEEEEEEEEESGGGGKILPAYGRSGKPTATTINTTKDSTPSLISSGPDLSELDDVGEPLAAIIPSTTGSNQLIPLTTTTTFPTTTTTNHPPGMLP